MVVDLSQATLDELKALRTDVEAEVQKRTVEETVLDLVWKAALLAKNKGVPRGYMMQTVTQVLNSAYGNGPVRSEDTKRKPNE